MRYIVLCAAATVDGALRLPDEGVLQVSDDEAERLCALGVADDVSADFAPAAPEKAKG